MADTDLITRQEMVEMFGKTMPIDAVNLLWDLSGTKTIEEVRAELRSIAATRGHQQIKKST